MKLIGSVAACVLLLVGIGTSSVLAQTVVTPEIAEGTGAVKAIAEAPARAAAALAVAGTGNAGPSAASIVKQARIGPDQLPRSAPGRLEFFPESRYAPGSDALAYVVVRQDRRRGVTFLLVGAALIGAGLIIEDDAGAAVSVGGAVLGAYGVYLIVRSER
jgi:hypothetical protein